MMGRILMVEPDSGDASEVESALRARGHAVEVVHDADTAVTALHAFRPTMVVLDRTVPGVSAHTFLRMASHAASPVEVVVCSAAPSVHDVVSAIRNGAFDYLERPLDPAAVLRLVDRCSRERRAGGVAAASSAEESGSLVGSSPGMVEVYRTIARVAPTEAAVLLRGETGTGKELVARAIHRHSDRAEHPFVAVNCTAVPENLLESELFGHVRGSFTGATGDRRGRFEAAGRGTLFLDEIGDTTPAFQAKLLRVLQDGEFHPVGSDSVRTSRARIVAATHHDLEARVRRGDFRHDLYYRLRVVEITLPPLRDRVEDVGLLARHFLARAASVTGRAVDRLPPEVLRRLEQHDWPGNVRELEHAVTRAAVLARGRTLHPDDLGLRAADDGGESPGDEVVGPLSMDEAERAQVLQVLERTGGNKRQAARTLRISRGRLDRLIRKHGLDRREVG
ncbi:sigma-54-dependent transcriptional regulator [Gaopeijia maritima]|uniref:sigma-54-dependent transcriptional regulator n=1 Tax=Gaopeijia maritima TaxID=3119007 RepID=UPI003869A5E6